VTDMDDRFDLVFLGSTCRNEMHRFDGTTEPLLGGPLFYSVLATTWSDKRVAVVTRVAARDADLLEPIRRAGIPVFVIESPETLRSHIYYPSEDVDVRRLVLETSAGPFSIAELPPIEGAFFHLVGHNRLEFPLDFVTGLHERGLPFSVDMQAFARNPHPDTHEILYEDYPHKRAVAEMADKIKLDAVEGRLLTGAGDPEGAAIQFEKWGTPEVMVTNSSGALVRHGGRSYFERFTNRNVSGRTGRGDTVFASYLVRRMDYGVEESLRFAVALCSMKMETPGPFAGSLEAVLQRMAAQKT
jgi:sugar/nucleoside kinase (ribokinase family)